MSDEWKSASDLAESITKAFDALKLAMNVIVAQELEKVNRMKKTVEEIQNQKQEKEEWVADRQNGKQQH